MTLFSFYIFSNGQQQQNTFQCFCKLIRRGKFEKKGTSNLWNKSVSINGFCTGFELDSQSVQYSVRKKFSS